MRRRDRDNVDPASNDPAAVIAQALRRKFANRIFQDSPGSVCACVPALLCVCVCVCVCLCVSLLCARFCGGHWYTYT